MLSVVVLRAEGVYRLVLVVELEREGWREGEREGGRY